MGVRIHALAKELDIPSKELMAKLRANGIKIASHLSSIHTDIANNIRREVLSRRAGGSDANGAADQSTGKTAKASPKAQAKAGQIQPKGVGGKPTGKRVVMAPGRAADRARGPIARRGPIIARSKTPPPESRGPRGGGRSESNERGPASGDAPSSGEGRSRRVRFFPGQSEYGGGSPPGGGGAPGAPAAGRRGRGRGGPQQYGARRGGGGGGRRGGGRRGGGRGRSSHGYQRQKNVLSPDRPSEVDVQLPITLKELSPILGIRQPMIMKALLEDGLMININSHLSEEMLLAIGMKFDVEINTKAEAKLESTLDELENVVDNDDDLEHRAPMVTFLGHVDHGKTSLLDKIRQSKVTAGEAGGITQHMSAYRVDQGNHHVVFIDTPGHKAFTEMRARGANVTDVVVLVVAADDGPMPQTEEAIQHAQAAGVSIVVAINKVDRPNANVQLTKQRLAELGLSPPEWGGETEMIEVSAITGQGIDDLLEVLTLETEILDLRANANKPAVGTVLDAKNTSGRGIVTTAIIQEGTLQAGDYVLCGPAWGRVRNVHSTAGHLLDEAGPSTPVEITGLDDLPEAGDRLYALDQNKARAIAEERKRKLRESERAQRSHVTLETLMHRLEETQTKEVNLIIKADVKGSLAVVKQQVLELATEEVGFKVLLGGVGEISESDVLLADASDAIILGFHVVANDRARVLAEDKNVEVRTYQVIYQLIEDMKQALEGILSPEEYEEVQSTVEIRQMYRSTKLGNIAGCVVKTGTLKRENPVRLIRDGVIIYSGKLSSLKRFKEDTNSVKEGFECGLRIEHFNDLKVGDVVESYAVLTKARKLSDSPSSSK